MKTKEAQLGQRRLHYAKNRAKVIAKVQSCRRARYGWPEGRYEAMLAAQNGVCAICAEPPKTRQLSADHHHATCQPRGLLCQRCNARVGWEESQSDFRKSVIKYIKLWEALRA